MTSNCQDAIQEAFEVLEGLSEYLRAAQNANPDENNETPVELSRDIDALLNNWRKASTSEFSPTHLAMNRGPNLYH